MGSLKFALEGLYFQAVVANSGPLMKLFVKAMFAVLVLAMLLPFTVLKGPDGRTLMSFSDIGLPDFSFDMPDMPDVSSGGGTATLQAGDTLTETDAGLQGKDIFYQWNDADGNIQFTTQPPPEGVPYTVKGYDPDANVIQSVKLPEPEAEKKSPSDKLGSDGKIGNPYEQESIKKLIQDAKNVEKMLSERYQQQEELLNQ